MPSAGRWAAPPPRFADRSLVPHPKALKRKDIRADDMYLVLESGGGALHIRSLSEDLGDHELLSEKLSKAKEFAGGEFKWRRQRKRVLSRGSCLPSHKSARSAPIQAPLPCAAQVWQQQVPDPPQRHSHAHSHWHGSQAHYCWHQQHGMAHDYKQPLRSDSTTPRAGQYLMQTCSNRLKALHASGRDLGPMSPGHSPGGKMAQQLRA